MLIIGIEQLRNKFCWNVVLQLLQKKKLTDLQFEFETDYVDIKIF